MGDLYHRSCEYCTIRGAAVIISIANEGRITTPNQEILLCKEIRCYTEEVLIFVFRELSVFDLHQMKLLVILVSKLVGMNYWIYL